jgi:hypothetical protein
LFSLYIRKEDRNRERKSEEGEREKRGEKERERGGEEKGKHKRHYVLEEFNLLGHCFSCNFHDGERRQV